MQSFLKDGLNENDIILEGEWRYSQKKINEILANGEKIVISKIPFRPNHIKEGGEIKKMKNLLTRAHYNIETNEDGLNQIRELFNLSSFSFPKPFGLIKLLVNGVSYELKNSIILDFFAGSGTTGQAVMNLNKEDNGNRKFILVEMGEHYENVLLKRIKKVMYSDNWKEGKALDNNGNQQIIKYFNMEQYEDTLNNLELTNKGDLLLPEYKEEYLLHYLLEMESRESLFDIDTFDKPFDYTIKTSQNGELKPTKVDLVETFNYLIGLNVKSVKKYENNVICIKGEIQERTKTKQVLIIWRDLTQLTQEAFTQFYTTELKGVYDKVYINGDTYNIPEAELTEAEFFRKMF